MKNTIRPLLLILLVLGAACAEQPSQRDTDGVSGTATMPGSDPISLGPTVATEYSAQLAEAATLLQQRQLLHAASILRDIDSGKLPQQADAKKVQLETELLYLQGKSALALEQLKSALARLDNIGSAARWQLQQWQVRLLLSQSGSMAAARQSQRLLATNPGETQREAERGYLSRFIWTNLNRCSKLELQNELARAETGSWQGWLELALLAIQVTDSPDVQVAELDFWRQRHEDHPAQLSPPGGLALLSQLEQQAPRHIALVLPLNGELEPIGRAILDGFLATQYESRRQGWPETQLSIIDSTRFEEVKDSYDAAVASGAQLVIGPWRQEHLNRFHPDQALPVPLLTLNWLDHELVGVSQMALSPGDEARQVARLAFGGGARHALLIRPQGSWGDEVSGALLQQWQALEGSVQAIATFSGQADYSSSLKSALNLAQSQKRATRVQRLMGEQVEFSPRRRRDLDVIFLLADQPQDARSLKPLIAFHYAADLPVYSTSHIFSGRADPQRDRDLNGIRLVEMPWLIADTDRLARSIYEAGADATLAGLHALGADAFLMNWRLPQLAASPDNVFRGQTGLLHMDPRGRLHRELVPTVMRGGLPKAL
jgi:outer membrane PBP1 activator LpoA protein